MGKIGKCCCLDEDCCICDAAWDYETWSVTVLGKTFSGSFSPATKPDPLTPANGCQSRVGDDCIVDNPTILQDCIQSSEWSPTEQIGMGSSICFEGCPQCFCLSTETGMQGENACLKEDLINWETQSRGVTHSRTWQQEAFYGVAQILCCDTPANSVRFIFDLYYHVARFGAASQQGFRRFRSVTYDCIYDPGEEATFPSNVVRSSWIEPVTVGSKPPCLPCDWDQSDFFENCPTLDSNCPPCPDPINGCPDEVVTYSMDYVGIFCNFIGFVDSDGDGICPIPDIENDFRFIYYGTHTLNAYVGSNTSYCNNNGNSCITDTLTAVIEHRFISDCIPCDELGCSVTLNRVTGASLGSSISQCVLDELECACGTIPQLCKTIPASVTLNLLPCT